MTSADSGLAPDLVADFKAAMRQLAATVTIVTAVADDHLHGMTATAVTSLCTDPPAFLVCVNRAASIHPALAVGQPFCVNILGRAHAELSLQFGGLVEPAARFAYGTWERNEAGVPFLSDATALVFGTVDKLLDYGTHSIVIGKATEARSDRGSEPLLYGNGNFRHLAS